MKIIPIILTLALAGTVYADPFNKAEITQTVNKVSVIQDQQAARPAAVGDVITAQNALKTGSDSRAELQFPDKTITRLGSNALFRFRSGGRDMTLDGGTMLFSSPKGEGGGQVQAGAVTAAVTGTDFLLSYVENGEVKVVVLEGKVWVFLTKFPAIRRLIKSGQLVVIPAGANRIPDVTMIDVKHLMETSKLLTSGGFKPLPSMALINRVITSQQGRIRNLPDGPSITGQQAAQTARQSTPGKPKQPNTPKPMVTPPPKPKPAPTPPKPKPSPRPTGSP